jgi:hypothetical protein
MKPAAHGFSLNKPAVFIVSIIHLNGFDFVARCLPSLGSTKSNKRLADRGRHCGEGDAP